MGAQIKITDSVGNTIGTIREVPFGDTISLLNNDQVGTITQSWRILTYPQDLLGTNPDFATNFPAWTVNPDGTLQINQIGGGPYPAVTFKPDISGDYLVELSSVEAAARPPVKAVVRIRDFYSGEAVPGAGLTLESSTFRGWAQDRNPDIKRGGLLRGRGEFCRVHNNSGGTISRGKIVKITGLVDAHSVAPNTVPGGSSVKREDIYQGTLADKDDADAAIATYVIADESMATGKIGTCQISGFFPAKSDVDYSGWAAVYDSIYLGDSGAQAFTGSILIGKVIKRTATDGGSQILLGGQFFSSGTACDNAPLDVAVGNVSDPGVSPNFSRCDHLHEFDPLDLITGPMVNLDEGGNLHVDNLHLTFLAADPPIAGDIDTAIYNGFEFLKLTANLTVVVPTISDITQADGRKITITIVQETTTRTVTWTSTAGGYRFAKAGSSSGVTVAQFDTLLAAMLNNERLKISFEYDGSLDRWLATRLAGPFVP